MYLLDSSAIITPFHRAQCEALSLALGHKTIDETHAWLKRWYAYGFSSGNLVVTYEIYDEVVNKCKKESRVERKILRELYEEGKITFPEANGEFYEVLVSIDGFVRRNYEPYQAETFLKKVDSSLVALSKVHGATLVVEERHIIPERDGISGRIKGEPRLPFVAATFGVKCVSIMAIMLAKHREWGHLLEESKKLKKKTISEGPLLRRAFLFFGGWCFSGTRRLGSGSNGLEGSFRKKGVCAC